MYTGFRDGLSFLDDNISDRTKSTIAYITSKYNTGYMTGDISGAWCVDKDVTSIGNLISSNPTFDDGLTGWTATAADASVANSILTVGKTGGDRGYVHQTFSVVSGVTYTFVTRHYGSHEHGQGLTFKVGTSGDNGSELSGQTGGSTTEYTRHYSWTSSFTGTAYLTLSGTNNALDEHVRYAYVCEGFVEDRSIKDNPLMAVGTPTVAPVATGSDVMAISGFSPSNYLEQPYNSDLDFGEGDFSVMGWVTDTYVNQGSGHNVIISNGGTGSNSEGWGVLFVNGLTINFHMRQGDTIISAPVSNSGRWVFFTAGRKDGVNFIYKNGVLSETHSNSDDVSAHTNKNICVGFNPYDISNTERWSSAKMSLLRISATAPTAEQIKEIYEAEKPLFQENAKCTLNGSSDAVTALAYDDSTELLHVGTSGGRSTFQGLRRVDETSTSTTEISAQGGLIVEETA